MNGEQPADFYPPRNTRAETTTIWRAGQVTREDRFGKVTQRPEAPPVVEREDLEALD